MYENEYEEYMRYVLGYPTNNNTYVNNGFPYRYSSMDNYEDLYPEIYRILKPMVEKACSNHRSAQISEDLLESMANEIYRSVEPDINVVNIDITAQEAEANLSRNSNRSVVKTASSGQVQQSSQSQNQKDESLTRACCGNPMLKDLIKILLLNQLINNDQHRPPRPPRPPVGPYPPRPPYGPYQPRPPYRATEDFGYNDGY